MKFNLFISLYLATFIADLKNISASFFPSWIRPRFPLCSNQEVPIPMLVHWKTQIYTQPTNLTTGFSGSRLPLRLKHAEERIYKSCLGINLNENLCSSTRNNYHCNKTKETSCQPRTGNSCINKAFSLSQIILFFSKDKRVKVVQITPAPSVLFTSVWTKHFLLTLLMLVNLAISKDCTHLDFSFKPQENRNSENIQRTEVAARNKKRLLLQVNWATIQQKAWNFAYSLIGIKRNKK